MVERNVAFDDGVQAGSSLAHGSKHRSVARVLGLNDRAPASPVPPLLSDSKWFLDELRNGGRRL